MSPQPPVQWGFLLSWAEGSDVPDTAAVYDDYDRPLVGWDYEARLEGSTLFLHQGGRMPGGQPGMTWGQLKQQTAALVREGAQLQWLRGGTLHPVVAIEYNGEYRLVLKTR